MMTKISPDINIYIYSYKGRHLKDVVENIYAKSSKKYTIGIGVSDQHPLNRQEIFEKLGVGYKHIFWDWLTNHSELRFSNALYSNSKYFMLLSDNVMLDENWDETLVDFCKPGQIISGNHSISISAENLFYTKKNKSEIDTFTKTDFIDRDLIFGDRLTMKHLNYPSYLKYHGVEDTLSLDLFTRGVSIYALPTKVYSLVGEPTMETLYVPFSLNHNYNEAIKLFKTGKNCCISIQNREITRDDFFKRHDFDFSTLDPLPFATNDVLYDPDKLNFNKVDARRYTATTRSIH